MSLLRSNAKSFGGLAMASACAFSAHTAAAQPVMFSASTPDDDRWMYPFNGTPGTRFNAPSFGATLLNGFDDRDGQYVIVFDTDAEITPGLGASAYRVLSVRLTAAVSSNDTFSYDPTVDAVETYFDPSDPDFVVDSDPGRPIELHALGFRSEFDLLSWTESSPFSVEAAPVPPAQGNRVVFSAMLDTDGVATDVSNNVKDRIETGVAAVGTADLMPGDRVLADEVFTFDVDVCDPAIAAYLGRSLSDGRIGFSISSLHAVAFDPDNPDNPGLTYPVFYTAENPLAQALGLEPTIELVVWVGSLADFDQDGSVTVFDILAFLDAWSAGDVLADADADCQFTVFDILSYLNDFNAG